MYEAVLDYFDLTDEQVTSKGREFKLKAARRTFCAMARLCGNKMLLPYSYPEIGYALLTSNSSCCARCKWFVETSNSDVEKMRVMEALDILIPQFYKFGVMNAHYVRTRLPSDGGLKVGSVQPQDQTGYHLGHMQTQTGVDGGGASISA